MRSSYPLETFRVLYHEGVCQLRHMIPIYQEALTNKWWHGARLYVFRVAPPTFLRNGSAIPSPTPMVGLSFVSLDFDLRRREGSTRIASMQIAQSPNVCSGASGSGSGMAGW